MSLTKTKLRLRPVGNHLLLQFIVDDSEQTSGGIIIPDNAKEKSLRAKIIALGHGRRDGEGKIHPFELEVGQTVLVAKYAGAEITFDDKKFTFVTEDDILAVVD